MFVGGQDEKDAKEVENPRQSVQEIPTPWGIWRKDRKIILESHSLMLFHPTSQVFWFPPSLRDTGALPGASLSLKS